MTKDGVQGKVMEVSVVLSLVVIVVYKVLNVVMGADVLYVLRSEKIFSMKSHSVKMPHKFKENKDIFCIPNIDIVYWHILIDFYRREIYKLNSLDVLLPLLFEWLTDQQSDLGIQQQKLEFLSHPFER